MRSINSINEILDSIHMLLGKKSALESDDRMSLKRLRHKQGKGLDSVAVSMSRIARPILARTMKNVREEKKKQRQEIGHTR